MTAVAVTENGLTLGDLAGTAMRAFYRAVGEPCPDETPPEWREAAGWALRAWEADGGRCGTYRVGPLARGMYETMYRDGVPAPFEALPRFVAVGLEAAVRHLFGAITCDRDDLKHMGEREKFWASWASERLAGTEVPT